MLIACSIVDAAEVPLEEDPLDDGGAGLAAGAVVPVLTAPPALSPAVEEEGGAVVTFTPLAHPPAAAPPPVLGLDHAEVVAVAPRGLVPLSCGRLGFHASFGTP